MSANSPHYFRIGDMVRYLPGVADGDESHSACEIGTVQGLSTRSVFVLFAGKINPEGCHAGDLRLIRSAPA